jgi:hypothetical protein
MNNNTTTTYFCPVLGCTHSADNTNAQFPSKLALLRHLNTPAHKTTHRLTDLSHCVPLGIFHCCCLTCPSVPRTFFPSIRALTIHSNASHPKPPHISPHNILPRHDPHHPPSPLEIASHTLHCFSHTSVVNHWEHGLTFISNTYDHEPPDFRTTWRHFLKSRYKASFFNLKTSIISAITASYSASPSNATLAPFWWLLLHLDMLIFAPSTTQQCNNVPIQSCIHYRIAAAFARDIKYLFKMAMSVRRLTQNFKSTSTSHQCTQRAADSDGYHTAVSRACGTHTIATIGPDNITHVNKLYTQPIPNRGHPPHNTTNSH